MKHLISLLVILMLVTGIAFAQESVVVESGEPVVLGFAAALTGEGLAPLGLDIRRGVELALAARPVVVVGGAEFPVTFDPQDDLCSPEGGQTVANRFAADEQIFTVIGPMCSSACEAAIPIFDEAGISSISASCTADRLTANPSASFNRVVTRDGFQGAQAADFIFNELGIDTIAVLDDGSTYGAGLVDVVVATFEELGGTVVSRDAVTVGDTDFRALLEEIAAEEPGLIYFGGFVAEAARLYEQRLDVGLEDVPMMGADGTFSPELVALLGEELAEGFYASAPVPAASEDLVALTESYIETFGEEPTAAFHPNAYDATNLILNAIEAVGTLDDAGNLVIDRAAFAEYIRSATLEGVTGSLACDGTGDCSFAEIGFYQVQMGSYVRLEMMMEEE